MKFANSQEERIRHMITKGDTMDTIAKMIGGNCTWGDIQQFCWATGAMSWQGSKKMISNRLKRFKVATIQQDREKLAGEIDESVSYLYNCAKQMRERIVAVERVLQKIK